MGLKFNPLTGQLENNSQTYFEKVYKTVDLALIGLRIIDLGRIPIDNSEMFFYNGMLLKDDCYSITGTNLVIDSGLDIRVGAEIDVRFAT